MAELELEVISTADNRGLLQAARDTDKLRGATDKLGQEFHDTADDSKELDQRIAVLRQSVRSLGAEFAKTQGPSVRTDLRSQRALLREFERIGKESQESAGIGVTIGSAIGTRAGSSAAGTFSKSFAESLSSGGRVAMFARVAAVLSPLLVPLGAMTAGLVLGTVGGGGVLGGIALASRDARVKQEWKNFGKAIVSDVDVAAAPFIQSTIDGIETLRATWQDIQPEMRAIFAAFSEGVGPLTAGIAGFLREAIPGFRAVGRAVVPFMEVLKEDLPELSKDISAFFQSLERGAPGAAQGLHDFITIVGNALRVTGFLLEGASRWWEKVRHEPWRLAPVAMPITGFDILIDQIMDLNAIQDVGATTAAKFTTGLEAGATAIGVASGAIDRQKRTWMDLRREIQLTADAYGEFIGLQLSQDQANLRVKQSLFDFNKTLKETGFDFRDTTEAGLRNQQLALDLVGAYDAQRQANMDAGMDAKAATDLFWKQVDSLGGLAGKSRDAKRFLDELKGRYKIQIVWEQIGQAVVGAANLAAGLLKKVFSFQSGGTTPAFAPFRVHEGEIMWSDKQHYVSSKAQTERLAAMGGSRGAVAVAPSLHFSGDVDSVFASAFMKLVRAGKITISSGALN